MSRTERFSRTETLGWGTSGFGNIWTGRWLAAESVVSDTSVDRKGVTQ